MGLTSIFLRAAEISLLLIVCCSIVFGSSVHPLALPIGQNDCEVRPITCNSQFYGMPTDLSFTMSGNRQGGKR